MHVESGIESGSLGACEPGSLEDEKQSLGVRESASGSLGVRESGSQRVGEAWEQEDEKQDFGGLTRTTLRGGRRIYIYIYIYIYMYMVESQLFSLFP